MRLGLNSNTSVRMADLQRGSSTIPESKTRDAMIDRDMTDPRPTKHPPVDPKDIYSLVRWWASQPFNRRGTDKTYVLVRFEAMRRFARLARTAKRVESHG